MRHSPSLAALSLLAVSLGGCTLASGPARPAAPTVVAKMRLQDTSGWQVGYAELRQRGSAWTLAIAVSGQMPGEHGLHFHDTGRCDAPDFASAKGHLNPHGKAHGSANPAGSHMGDLPNLQVGSDGTASTVLSLPGGFDPAVLFDADGTALVLHAMADDYRTDPSGNSGRRVACGALSAN